VPTYKVQVSNERSSKFRLKNIFSEIDSLRQFSQFIALTQIFILFQLYASSTIQFSKFYQLNTTFLISHFLVGVFMFFNSMFVNSLFTHFLILSNVASLVFQKTKILQNVCDCFCQNSNFRALQNEISEFGTQNQF
jgi:hypothetical protein